MKCFGCFKPIASGEYCPKCKKELFNGRNINHLKFDIKEFYEYRQSQATRISISGVQDKISLRLEGNDLVPTTDKGEFILKPVPATQLKHSEDIVANEHLSMQLSKQVFKIPTAANAIIHFSNLDLFTHHETKSYGALGFYSLEDCEVFGIMIGIPPKRLVKIYQDIFSKVQAVEQMIMESFMSENGKIAYITNFTERIQKRLCYTMSQHGFEFDSVIKPLAQEYLDQVEFKT